jgi:hypothetical protein
MNIRERLEKEGIPFVNYLPKLENGNYRDRKIIASRVAILFIFKKLSSDKSGISIVKDYIERHNLDNYLTTEELSVLNTNTLTFQQEINFSWYQESLFMLIWCLEIINSVPPAYQEVNINKVVELIPPYVDPKRFNSNSNLRDWNSIKNELDYYYHLHWAIKHPESWKSNFSLRRKLNISIIVERRKALEWVYNNELEWDNISLDT